ncbi:hypothetical protein VN96_1882 [Lactococcus cremoris]|nr:hypothetical protein VN96_1882 [Lactococcus cremoris]
MSLDNFKKQTITWDMINQTFEQPIQIMGGRCQCKNATS